MQTFGRIWPFSCSGWKWRDLWISAQGDGDRVTCSLPLKLFDVTFKIIFFWILHDVGVWHRDPALSTWSVVTPNHQTRQQKPQCHLIECYTKSLKFSTAKLLFFSGGTSGIKLTHTERISLTLRWVRNWIHLHAIHNAHLYITFVTIPVSAKTQAGLAHNSTSSSPNFWVILCFLHNLEMADASA